MPIRGKGQGTPGEALISKGAFQVPWGTRPWSRVASGSRGEARDRSCRGEGARGKVGGYTGTPGP